MAEAKLNQIDELADQVSMKSIRDMEVNELDQILQLADLISNYVGEDGSDPDPILRSYQRTNALIDKYRITHDRKNSTLEECLSWWQIVLRVPPEDEITRLWLVFAHSIYLGRRLVRTEDVTLLHEFMKYLQQVIDHRDAYSTIFPRLTLHLGIMFEYKYFRSGEQSDFEKARSLLSEAQGTSEDEQEAAFRVLIDLYDESFIRSESELHRDESLRLRKKRSDMGLESVGVFRIDQLVKENLDRFSVRQSIEDIEKAMEICLAACKLVPQDDFDYPDWLYWLSFYTLKCFQRTGVISLAQIAHQAILKALNITDQEHADYPKYLVQISEVLSDLYLETNDTESLDDAIQFNEQALSIVSEGHWLWHDALFNRSILLGHRYTSKGALADLNESISLGEQLLASNDDAPRSDVFLSMAKTIHHKYERTDSSLDLENAIKFAKRSIEELRPDDSGKLSCFALLSKLLLSQSQLYGSYHNVEEAVEYAHQALQYFEGNEIRKCNYLLSYIKAMLEKYSMQTYNGIEDKSPGPEIDDIVAISLNAMKNLPDAHSLKSSLWLVLGHLFLCKLVRASHAIDWQKPFGQTWANASVSYIRCLVIPGAQWTRIEAATHLVNTGLAYDSRVTAGMLGILLVQEFQAQLFTLKDKQHWASQILGLASDTAAAMMGYEREQAQAHREVSHLGMGWLALATLSRGRGMVLSSIKGRNLHSMDVEESNSELGKTSSNAHMKLMDQICHGLESTLPGEAKPDHVQSTDKDKHRGEVYVDDLVNDILGIPELDYFLNVPRRSDILEAAKSGPIVVLNLSVQCLEGCDIFIITQSHLKVLHLKDIEYDAIRYWALSGEKIWSQQCLTWLWDTTIMDALGFTQPPDNDHWPHVTWIPTGVMSKFPFHASGRHESGGHDTVMDRVVSSYGTSVQTLVTSRLQAPVVSTPVEALLVAMSNTPGHSTLPYAANEVCEIEKTFKRTSVNAAQVRGYKEDIKSRLSNCNIFQFAGHGYTDYVDPSKSHLCLEDKNSPLSVAELFELNMDQGAHFLAYLSACGTGRVREEKFLDESIHLISAFQVLGFRHVIGTLWEVQDETCMDIARLTYQVIRDESMTDKSVSRRLHKATKRLRDEWLAEYSNRSLDRRAAMILSAEEGISNLNLQERGDDAREGRDMMPLEDNWGQSSPPPWIAYVHYGV
ncbi:unnamed protein product [Clonostachys byssicola]|uniref:CHAT domain-containing protein n=1 Tax=Clonostachys byssicola TaxID=160290 RepID=A0A9N9UT44_9HYPO|nr:unnamed protein product [Clonostachys byssicola]